MSVSLSQIIHLIRQNPLRASYTGYGVVYIYYFHFPALFFRKNIASYNDQYEERDNGGDAGLQGGEICVRMS